MMMCAVVSISFIWCFFYDFGVRICDYFYMLLFCRVTTCILCALPDLIRMGFQLCVVLGGVCSQHCRDIRYLSSYILLDFFYLVMLFQYSDILEI